MTTGARRLTAIARTQRTAQVRMQLEEAIRRGDFTPGERLPSERELVQTFGVSRVSVREAIRSLEALGVIRVQHGLGAFVTDRRSGFGEPLARWLASHSDEVGELHRVRGALDELACASAAERQDEAALAKLVAADEELRTATDQGAPLETLIQLDIAFHLAIAEASGNRLLYDLLFDLQTKYAESRHFVFSTSERPKNSSSEHKRIVDAIVAGDPDAARRAMTAHIESIRSIVVGAGADADRGL